IEPEPVADDLLEHGLVALALAVGAREQRRCARVVETYLGALSAGGRCALDGVGEAEAAQSPALARFRLARLEALGVGELDRHIHVLLELAAVVSESEAGLERHHAGRNVIA